MGNQWRCGGCGAYNTHLLPVPDKNQQQEVPPALAAGLLFVPLVALAETYPPLGLINTQHKQHHCKPSGSL
jgi:hypothetical protein